MQENTTEEQQSEVFHTLLLRHQDVDAARSQPCKVSLIEREENIDPGRKSACGNDGIVDRTAHDASQGTIRDSCFVRFSVKSGHFRPVQETMLNGLRCDRSLK